MEAFLTRIMKDDKNELYDYIKDFQKLDLTLGTDIIRTHGAFQRMVPMLKNAPELTEDDFKKIALDCEEDLKKKRAELQAMPERINKKLLQVADGRVLYEKRLKERNLMFDEMNRTVAIDDFNKFAITNSLETMWSVFEKKKKLLIDGYDAIVKLSENNDYNDVLMNEIKLLGLNDEAQIDDHVNDFSKDMKKTREITEQMLKKCKQLLQRSRKAIFEDKMLESK